MSKIKIVMVGMGNRAGIYASESLKNPELFEVVGVVDRNPDRVKIAKETYNIPDEYCFLSVEALVSVPKFADAAINTTMDNFHVETSAMLMHAGYDILLEKPFATTQNDADKLIEISKKTGRRVMVCHILRYTPFYSEINRVVKSGEIGKIINIQMSEHVSYYHESVSFVRGKYASADGGASGMILSKCSHDLDILAWLMGDNRPKGVSSIGSVFQFKPEMAPKNAGTHCLNSCEFERNCPYSAKRLYIEAPQRWAENIWRDCGAQNPTDEEKNAILSQPDNPFSRCIYRCNPTIVDHQSVLVNFENGATANFSMVGGAAIPRRKIHIIGTKGELEGVFETGKFTISKITADGVKSREIDVSHSLTNAHGGGDQALVRDFIALLKNEPISPCAPSIEESVTGHRLAFLAEDSRLDNGKMINF